MTVEGLGATQALFDAALDQPPARREEWVREQAGEDHALAARVLRLLRNDAAADAMAGPFAEASLDVFAPALAGSLVPALLEGRRIGPWILEREIGAGGMGRVFRASRQDGEVSQQVAIKLVRGELASPEVTARFLRERTLLASLDHPGIARLIDAGALEDGTPYVVMDLVEGEDILSWCNRTRPDLSGRLLLFRAVLDAVTHAHRRLVVHRDIKAGNVLVDATGRPRLLDFGIAKALARGPAADQTGTAERFFTPATAAPEQVLGRAAGVAADVYALGALLYQLLCGKPPFRFDGLTAGEVERLVLQVPPPAMSARLRDDDLPLARARGEASVDALRRRLRGDLEAIVQRCLRKDPEQRYASVEQLDADIAAVLEQRPISIRSAGRLYRARLFVRRHRLATALASGLALVLVTAAALLAYQALALVEQHQRTLAERDRAQQAIALLRDAFIAADPAGISGGEVRVRHVLESAHPRLARLEQDHPELFVELASTLAEVELAIGLQARAGEIAARAARAAARSGASAEEVHRLHALSAIGHAAGGSIGQARSELAAALATGSPPSAAWHIASSRLLRLENSPEAVDAARRAVALLEEAPPADHLAAAARWQLADTLRASGSLEESLAEIERTLAWQTAGLESDNSAIALTRLRRADALRKLDRLAEADDEAGAVLQGIAHAYGTGNTFTAYGESLLALIAHARGDPDRSVAHQRRAVAAWEAAVGESHPNAARALFNLAQMLAGSNGDFAETDALFREATRRVNAAGKAASNGVVMFRRSHAGFLLDRQRPRAALTALLADGIEEGWDGLLEVNRTGYATTLRAAYAEACPAAPAEDCSRAAVLLEFMARTAAEPLTGGR